MRYIEIRLMELGVPSALFRSESAIFFHHYCVAFGNDKKCRECKDKNCDKSFPKKDKESKIGLMRLEKRMVYIIRLVWFICFSIFLYQIQENCDITTIYTTFLSEFLLAVYLIVSIGYTIYGWALEDREDREDEKSKNRLFWDLKEDLVKCPKRQINQYIGDKWWLR